MNTDSLATLDWQKQGGLIPAIVQDANSMQILMLGYMNQEALAQTLQIGKVTFFSRSKNRLWTKGESSGHFLDLVSIEADCDNDSLLIQAKPNGPTCHLQRASCFENAPQYFLTELENRIAQRKQADPNTSYSKRLMDSGLAKVAQKVGEEAVETVIAALVEDEQALLNESADLVYHLLVLLQTKDIALSRVLDVLKQR
jgi:phosphoribosyl-ATP pyrophosphohydrolase/phosphoribosyl-AMP cyclohydrolase